MQEARWTNAAHVTIAVGAAEVCKSPDFMSSSRTPRGASRTLRSRAAIRGIHCDHFKAFLQFTANFDGDAYLVGPNNSGKSTLIAALRAAARLLHEAHRRDPDATWVGPEGTRPAWTFSADQSGLIDENIRHEFIEEPATLHVRFDSEYSLVARWAPGDEGDNEGPLFTLFEDTGYTPTTAAEVGRGFPEIGIVPILGPVEQEEQLASRRRVEANFDTRLASRFFRSDMYWDEADHGAAFRAFAERWLPEVTLAPMRLVTSQGGFLDLFYTEASRREKELFWAGDGVQVFLQLLWHLFQQWNASTVILDEPEVSFTLICRGDLWRS